MADIELVIKIPNEIYQDIVKNRFLYDEDSEVVSYAIINGTFLPKGHGRLIDADALYDQYEYADYDFDKTMEYAPTIMKADEAESEVEE